MNVIMKFGGTSVQDAEAMSRVINIVKSSGPTTRTISRRSSSCRRCRRVTDRLVGQRGSPASARDDAAAQILSDLLTRHLGVAETLVKGDALTALNEQLTADFQALIADVRGWAAQGEVTPAAADVLQAMGELASSRIVAAAFREQGVNSVGRLAQGARHRQRTLRRAAGYGGDSRTLRSDSRVATRAGQVPVMARLHRRNHTGRDDDTRSWRQRLLGGDLRRVPERRRFRSGPTSTACSPPTRVVSTPVLVPELSFNEASELAYFGAKVLPEHHPAGCREEHPGILNSRRPEVRGTMITAEDEARAARRPRWPASAGVTVIDITSSRMLMAFGFCGALFEVFERFRDAGRCRHHLGSEVSVTVDTTRRLDDIISNLRNFAEVSTTPNMAIVCIVGENLRSDSSLFADAVTALGKIPLRLVS